MGNITNTITTAPIMDLVLRLGIVSGFLVIVALVVVFVIRVSRIEKAGLGGVEFDTTEESKTTVRRKKGSVK